MFKNYVQISITNIHRICSKSWLQSNSCMTETHWTQNECHVYRIVWFRTNSESLEILYKFKVYITKTAIHASIFDVDFKYFEFGPSHWRSKIHIESTFWTITTWNKELRPETVFAHEISSWKTNIFNKRTAKAHLNVVHQECEWNNCYSDKRKQQKYHHQHQKACDLTLVKTKPKTKSKIKKNEKNQQRRTKRVEKNNRTCENMINTNKIRNKIKIINWRKTNENG